MWALDATMSVVERDELVDPAQIAEVERIRAEEILSHPWMCLADSTGAPQTANRGPRTADRGPRTAPAR